MFPETALVTGGASGIGRALVERLEAEGAEVRVLDLRRRLRRLGSRRHGSRSSRCELACLNAGVVTGEGDVRELTDEQYRRIVGANADGVVFGVRRLARVMEPGGAIVVTASLAGLTTMEPDPIYAATKHFAVGFVRSVASQLAELGLTINAVCPAIVDTPILGGDRERVLAAGIPMLQPEEIADAILAAPAKAPTGQCWTCLPAAPPERHEFHRFFASA